MVRPCKDKFEALVKQPMLELIALVCDDLRGFAVDHVTDPAKSLFRIYRDTRFSKDKSPYKTQIAANFPRRGLPKYQAATFYFSVSHKGVEVAGGLYMPGPLELSAVRDAIAESAGEFRKIIVARPLRSKLGDLQGECLARVSPQFGPDHPAADLLRYKQFYFYQTLPSRIALEASIRREIIARFRAVAPFVHFLNGAILKRVRQEHAGVETIPKRPEPMF